jgi:hypothetical protein
MKTHFKKNIIGLLLCIASIAAWAQCPYITNLNVTYGLNGTATVTPIFSGPIGTSVKYNWVIFSGNAGSNQVSSSQVNGEFQLYTNDTYSLSLNVFDSINNCTTGDRTVLLYINNVDSAVCNSGFTFYTDTNCLTHFINTSTGSNLTYKWNINGGNYTSTNVNSNLLNGTYLIGLQTYYNGFICSETNKNITVYCNSTNTVSPCNASFNYFVDSSCVTHFINTSVGSNINYYWHINSSTYSTSNPTVNLSNGSYTASLVGNNGVNTCGSSQFIAVSCSGNGMPTGCNASFFTTTDSSCVTTFINNSNGALYSSFDWNIDGLTYTVTPVLNLGNGSHIATLNLYSGNLICSSYQNTVNISCSGTGTPLSYSNCNVNAAFTIFSDSLTPGHYYASNNSSGSGVLSYLWDFGDGFYSNQQYPSHSYAIPGHYAVCLIVSSTNGTVTCTDNSCDSSSVKRVSAGYLMSELSIVAYPNPISDELTIETPNLINHKLKIYLTDILGKTVFSGNLNDFKVKINTSNLEQGCYNLLITNEKDNVLKVVKLIK